MKKKRAKAIAKLVEQLPVSYEVRDHTQMFKGKDLTPESKAEAGHEFHDEQHYLGTRKEVFVINHYKRIKKKYAEKGTQGIIDYLEWLNLHNQMMALKYKDGDIQQVPEKIMKIARGGVNKFWRLLMIFLFSFVKVFQNESLGELQDDK